MSQKLFFLLAAMLMSSLAAAQTPATGVIAGVVLERGSGQPVADAEVRVDNTNLRTSTNAIGRFQLPGVSVGRITLLVRASGFLELRLSDMQVAAGTPLTISAELEKTPNFLDRVQVT